MIDRAADPTSWQAFERKYQTRIDPWDFADSAYELARYKAILAALSASPYRCIYEPGCSVGVLTRNLAGLAQDVVATDFAPSAVAEARRRCAGFDNVKLVVADVRTYRPEQPPDLIIFSEIGYYFGASELRSIATSLAEILLPNGELLAAHWLGHSADHVLHGDVVHEQLRAALPLEWAHGVMHEGFRIDQWRKRGNS